MTRLNLVVECQAEETYVTEVLAGHLAQFGVAAVARRVEFSRSRHVISRGGLLNYGKLRKDVVNWLNQDQDAAVTTMVDLYALPENFPGRSAGAKIADPRERVLYLESAFREDISSTRFIPFIQLHEFEAMLFVDITKLLNYYPAFAKEVRALQEEVSNFDSPELIDEGKHSAPSKRILHKVPAYEKVSAGTLIAIDLGLPAIRRRCPHFHQWLNKLECPVKG